MTFNQDRLGNDYSYDESIRRIRANADVPIYGIWEMYLGKGIVGGMLTSGYEQGNLSAQMATRILQGESPSQIPVVRNPPNHYMFDNAELSRFGISALNLPSGSIIVNQPVPVRVLPGIRYMGNWYQCKWSSPRPGRHGRCIPAAPACPRCA